MDIVITEFSSRKKPNGKIEHTTWEDLVERLKSPVITEETIEDYKKASNEDRTDIKDVGGYVAGEFENGKRDKTLLKSRYILTIDADEATSHDVDDYECCYDYTFFVHTTHTSTEEQPRLRWLFPLSRPVTAEEYRMLIGVAKSWVGADTIDETTDQPERLMFWPSVSVDADYCYWQGGTVVVDPDELLDGIDPEDYEIPVASSDKVSSDTEDFDFGSQITEGSRNISVFKYGSKLREFGFDDDLLLEAITRYNDEHCVPPLPSRDIKTIAHSICTRYKKGEYIPYDVFTADSDFGDLGESKKKELAPPLENGNQLLGRYIKPAVFLVEDMVTTGLGMVVAPPKFGKSWFALDLAISIATGRDFFGKKTTRAGVLYYALEDNDRRIQNRLDEVSGSDKELTWFYHKEDAPTMNDGLFDEIDAYLKMYPEIKFIVIDTLQKVRPPAKKSEGAYSNDYNDAGKIQKYALKNDISILLVHHTRKIIDPNDLIGNISGTNGLSGAIDYAFGMSKKKWDDDQAKLELTGRDIDKQVYMMTFNQMSYRWENLGSEKQVRESEEDRNYREDPVVRVVKDHLNQLEQETDMDPVEWKVSAKELYDACLKSFHTAGEGIDSSLKVGKKVSKMADMFSSKDEIEVLRGHDRESRYYTFSRYRIDY